jgi:hypothetical protein
MGLAKPGEPCGLTVMCQDLDRQESAGRVFGRVWNFTELFLRSEPGPVANTNNVNTPKTRSLQSTFVFTVRFTHTAALVITMAFHCITTQLIVY